MVKNRTERPLPPMGPLALPWPPGGEERGRDKVQPQKSELAKNNQTGFESSLPLMMSLGDIGGGGKEKNAWEEDYLCNSPAVYPIVTTCTVYRTKAPTSREMTTSLHPHTF